MKVLTDEIPGLTAEALEEYIASDGFVCPFCRGTDLEWEPKEVEDDVTQPVRCKTCKRNWVDRYGIVDIYIEMELIDIPEEPNG